MLPEGIVDRNPQRLIIFHKQTPASEGKGGKQSYATVSGCCVYLQEQNKVAIKKSKIAKNKNCKFSKTQNQTTPNKAANVLFLTKKRRTCLSGVLIQLKINTGNEAASLSKRAASLPLSLYVAGRRQYRLCCQDAAQTLEGFFFLSETLAGLCIMPLSLVHETVSAKHENYSWLDQNLEQQLFLDDQLREQRWIGEAWCARCMQPFVKDIEIIVEG